MIALIAAYDRNRVIGYQGTIPWHLPDDLEHFKKLTSHHTVIMGRRTYESIGHPLPERTNIIISTTLHLNEPNCFTVSSIDEAIDTAKDDTIFFIGGATIYKEALALVDTMYITEIDAIFEGDTFFPSFNASLYSKELIQHIETPIPHTFYKFTRKRAIME